MTDTTDTGPTPPSWCDPGARPDLIHLDRKYGGGQVAIWERVVSDQVWIGCEDRYTDTGIVRGPGGIYAGAAPRLDTAAARRLAAELIAAADELDRLEHDDRPETTGG